MKVKLRKCKFCQVPFKPTYSTTQNVCSHRCAIEYSKIVQIAKDNREWQREKKERKEALLTHSEWLNLFQKVFNAYIRSRDKGQGCISCGTKKNVQYAAGHYFSVGAFPNVRFDEDNVHLQCNKRCNGELSGNIIEYRPKLIEKIGIERFEALEYRARNESGKLSIPEIKEKIKEYKEKTKELSKKNT